jgi:hypothetical protein
MSCVYLNIVRSGTEEETPSRRGPARSHTVIPRTSQLARKYPLNQLFLQRGYHPEQEWALYSWKYHGKDKTDVALVGRAV